VLSAVTEKICRIQEKVKHSGNSKTFCKNSTNSKTLVENNLAIFKKNIHTEVQKPQASSDKLYVLVGKHLTLTNYKFI
jgi:CRISPR/Cas system CMR-associated protein Cmr1 (group 7 of RAMP superfamily)